MRSFDLNVPRYSAGLFSWTGNHGVADASALQCGVGKVPHVRCYLDNELHGMEIQSPITGSVKQFVFVSPVVDSDGDITHWIYNSIDLLFTLWVINS